jgi:16S rRNA (uracil1498-N3)-methyltransferase
MRRRWIADTYEPATGHPTHAALTGDQALHLAKVLRAETGQVFDVVAGGFLHRAEVTAVTHDRVDFVLLEELDADAALPLSLYLAIFKFDHFEWAVEKATELGVARVTPVLARRTEKHLAQASVKRVERWRRIVHEAARQSRRTSVPTVADPVPVKAALAACDASVRILLSETEQERSLSAALNGKADAVSHAKEHHPGACEATHTNYALAIGPEGGWTADEMALFTQHQWTHVTLGPRILRAETAAIAGIAIAGALLG